MVDEQETCTSFDENERGCNVMKKILSVFLSVMMCLGLMLAAVPDSRADDSPVKKNGWSVSSADELRMYDIVTFGTYPLRSYDSYVDLEWIVLRKSGNQATLLTRDVIDTHPYNGRDARTGWEGSDLNSWLNDAFRGMAFTSRDEVLINGSITIPSLSDARSMSADMLNPSFTPYAVSRGADSGKGIWWLRDGTSTKTLYNGETINVASVVQNGAVLEASYKVTFNGKGVRPMLTIDFDRGNGGPGETKPPTNLGWSLIYKGNQPVRTSDDVRMYDDVTFGNYPYRSYSDIQPIHWVVIGKNGTRIKLLSALALDSQKYQEPYGAVSWRLCSLNEWLNTVFVDMAFDYQEQGVLAEDVTLLSEAEAQQIPLSIRCTRSTEFAISRGADPSRCIWWLRDGMMRQVTDGWTTNNIYCASAVREAGDIGTGYYRVDLGHKTVRPVIEVDLSRLP